MIRERDKPVWNKLPENMSARELRWYKKAKRHGRLDKPDK